MEKRYSWVEIHNMCGSLAGNIRRNVYEQPTPRPYDLIIGVARGGLIPACILSHLLDNIPVCCISVSSYTCQNKKQATITHQHIDPNTLSGKKVLIVDDLTDSGHTLQTIQEFYRLYDIVAHTATIFIKPDAIFKPDFYVHSVPQEDWIIFPYEVSTV